MGMLEEIGSYLEAQNIAGLGGTLFLGRLPDEPDSVTALYEQAGFQPVRYSNRTTANIEAPRLQVIARAADYAEARRRIRDIYESLNGVADVVMGSTCYLGIRALQSPFELGRDANERARFVVNFQIQKRPS